MFKENTAYVILALVAIVLIGVTIGLQIVILSDQPESTAASATAPNLGTESLSGQIQNNAAETLTEQDSAAAALTDQDDSANNADSSSEQVALAIPASTDTPEVIVLEPTSVPPTATALATATPLPTSTPLPTNPPPPTDPPPTDPPPTLPPVDPTSTPLPSSETQQEGAEPETSAGAEAEASEAVATDTPVAPLPTATTRPDLLLGFMDRGQNCTAMTQIAAQIMEEELGATVDFVSYNDSEVMIQALAQQSIDVTLCYMDPDDRQLMREFLGDIRQVGTQHMVGDGYKLQLWANGGSKAKIREEMPCVLDFLEKIDFTELVVDANSVDTNAASTFIAANSESISQWLDCPYQ